jgi:MoaA/NifB/PqqE/SkfB family radical SAM enzyme
MLPEMKSKPWIGPNGQVMERLELHLTYHCPERCVFCSEAHRMKAFSQFPVTWGRVAKVLRIHAARGVRNVHFTGGEPTIHPKFVDALRLAKKLGMRTSIGTIGTMLCKPEFVENVIEHLDEALFSIHGPTPEVHDKLTRRSGSFERVTKALRNVLSSKPDFGVYVNTVVTKHNIEFLPATIEFLDGLGAKLIVVSNTTPEGDGGDNYEELAVPLDSLGVYLPQAAERAQNSVLRFFGIPMCLLGEHSALSNDLHWDPRVTVEWKSEPGKVAFAGIYSWKPDRRRVQVESCGQCNRNKICMGVFDEYVERWPTDGLQPFR